jgi:hypothetical protein
MNYFISYFGFDLMILENKELERIQVLYFLPYEIYAEILAKLCNK